jgi:hypothetical protein
MTPNFDLKILRQTLQAPEPSYISTIAGSIRLQ